MTASYTNVAFYIAEAKRAPQLGRDEEATLVVRWRNGERAAGNVLARANLRHVVSVAIKYRHYGVPLSELVAEGNFGMVHALGKFDPERGIRFMTYAAHWTKAYILDYVIQSWSMVGGGSGPLRSNLFFKLRRERTRIANLMGEGEAADRALAERVGMAPEDVKRMIQRLDARDVSLDVPAPWDGAGPNWVDLLPAPDDQERDLFDEEADGWASLIHSIAQHGSDRLSW
jgi:RNA polymerase sigma-32 factor